MKRRTLPGAAALVAMQLVCAAAFAQAPGDINSDGAVDAVDVQTVINAVLEISIAPLDPLDADVNGDGRVDALDIQLVINIVLGIDVSPGGGAEERMAAMDEAGSYFAGLDTGELGIDGKVQQMLAWLNAHDDFVEAGASDDGVVWAFFGDGFPVAFVDTYPLGAGELPKLTQAGPSVRGSGALDGPAFFRETAPAKLELETEEIFTNELPKSNKVEVVAALEEGFQAYTAAGQLAGQLVATGYEPGPLMQADSLTIQQFREMEDIGVLLLFGHAGEIQLDRDIPGDFLDLGEGFLVQTPVPVTVAEIPDVLPDVKAGRVVPIFSTVYVDGNGALVKAWRWAITHEFIETYVEFATDAVVGVFGCNSYNEQFMEACFAKGAGAYFGFDEYIFDDWAAPSFRHLISRALGSVVTAEWDSSPVRPFDFWPTLREMERRGILTDDLSGGLPPDLPPDWQGGATLRMKKPEGSRVSILAPSIRVVRVNAAQEVLEVHGLFGDAPQPMGPDTRVTVGGTALPVLSWDRWEIRCALPAAGAGAAGGVQVTVNGVRSNVVTLSEFESSASFTMSTDAHGPFATAEADFRFRMPMQPFRILPDSEPIFILDEDILESDLEELQLLFLRYMEAPGPVIGVWEADSTLAYAYEGQYQERGCGAPGFVSGEGVLNAHVFDWSNPTSLPIGEPFVMAVCTFFPDPDSGEMLMTINPATSLALGHHNSACSGLQEFQLIDGTIGDGEIRGPMNGYDLLEGDRTASWSGGQTTVTWSDIVAVPQPPW